MRTPQRTATRRRRGSALLPMALSLTALIGMAGLAVDTTRAYLVRSQLSAAVDAAALAAARVPPHEMEPAASAVFQANFPAGALGAQGIETGSFTAGSSSELSFRASAHLDTYFMTVLGQPRVTISASATARRLTAPEASAPLLLLADEDTIGPGVAALREFCGEERLDPCLNSDIAGEGVRAALFARPAPPASGPALLSLPAGRAGDEGLFRFGAASREQFDRRSRARFSLREFVDAAGAAASRNNLSEVEDVEPLGAADLAALAGRDVCLVVFAGEIEVEPAYHYGRLDAAARGLVSLRVVAADSGASLLPSLTVEVLPSERAAEICGAAAAAAASSGGAPRLVR